ncbi:MAG: aminotransferase class I/II-fold pyridoxal phosphate-dependent enzyme [Candidatus Eremiobacteraeota bacterium]|nr:aminotransferase class I/II-fold pyridoxal phosphate-dependent enzyme [Candidatus Eremiobacteraeota bacterium]
MSSISRSRALLDDIARAGQLRTIDSDPDRYAVDFSTNDYLALARDPQVVAALQRANRVGSGGARLLGGPHREHVLLEQDLAAYLNRERAVLFSSGYLAAMGAIGALGPTVNIAYSDERNHASLIDGLRLSKLERHIYPHRDLPPKAARKVGAMIVTESLFSMDGDRAHLAAMLSDLHADDLLVVDEAHAIGVTGPNGAGLAAALADDRVVIIGTLSKALGAQGGFVAGHSTIIELIVNTARTFIFDTALPPAVALAARIALYLAKNAEERRERIRAVAIELQHALYRAGFNVPDVEGPIVPVIVGSAEDAVALSGRLRKESIKAPAIRPPTVPEGTSRLRLSVRSDHTADHVQRFIETVACTATS